jgi:AraC-like DNA-binding protein
VGDLVLFVPTAPIMEEARAFSADASISLRWRATPATWPLIGAALEHLRLEGDATRADESGELLRLLLSVLLLRLAPLSTTLTPATDTVCHRFRDAVEEDFRIHHDVADYARRLGYSARTLSRSAQAATGRSAKQLIGERVALEAKRLLAHDRLSPTTMRTRLGFADASNFSLFSCAAAEHVPGHGNPRT